MSQPIRRAAMDIVLREETERGWRAQELGIAAAEKEHGCDILSSPPEGGEPHPVEVKGWGEPFMTPSGLFRYPQDIRESQFQAARRDARYRIEIVANLTAYLAGREPYERLTLTAEQIRSRATPRLYDVALTGMEGDIRPGSDSTLPVRPAADAVQAWFVPGRPTPFAGGENDRIWKRAIAEHVPPAPEGDGCSSANVDFVLAPEQDRARGGDLDNLLEPVMSVVVNTLGWCGRRRPNLRWVAARKRFEGQTGVEIALGATAPSWPPESFGRVLLRDIYTGPLPASATDPVFADWVGERMAGVLDDGRAALRLSFATDAVNLGDVGTGKVKPLIDGFWPLLGGTPAAPDDWRIRLLLVEKGAELPAGVGVWLAALPR